ncbi:MAG: hypothetical protein ACP5SD_02565 [Elusimicrobiales bacterium]
MRINEIDNKTKEAFKIKNAAREFEKIVIKEMIKTGKKEKFENSVSADMFEEAISSKICEKGIGLSDYIFRNLGFLENKK